tara:strand:+ start:66 stop:1169 length:1104 start_codon:yes stop_codon:yes gene_type:complete
MINKQKVLIVSSEFPPEPGGIGNHAYNIAKYLTNNKQKVSVIADQRLNNRKNETLFDSNLSFKIVRIKRHPIRILMYINRIFQIFKHTYRNEMIIASGKFPLWIVAITSLFFREKKFIAVVHGSEVNFKKKILRKTIDISLKKFDHIIAVSNFTKSLISYLKLTNITVIPNGFELSKTSTTSNEKIKGKPSLITVGSISERKGQRNVINALPYLIQSYPEIHYHMVGKPYRKDEFFNLAKKLGVDKHITFHGAVSDKIKIDLLQNSDIFTMLSQNTASGDVEGFGIAILEANSLGIPTIGAKNCGIEDAILDYKSGILIQNNNPSEFEKSIKNILENYNLYGYESIIWASKFSWNNIIKEYIKILEL